MNNLILSDDGKTVTGVLDRSITSVTIPEGVTSIGGLYECHKLTSVILPNSVTSIEKCAFQDCSSLTSVTIGNNVTSIGDLAFEGCSNLANISIPDSVKSIGEEAFWGCKDLTAIIIPDSVERIGHGAFKNCSNLASIYVSSNNTVYDSRNNCNAIIETSTNMLIAGCKNTIIPDSVSSIGKGAFGMNDNITSVAIPENVKSIGDEAFESCDNLASVIIGNNVTSIGKAAFYYCDQLTSVYIGISVTTIGEDAFLDCAKLKFIYIPDSVTSIGNNAFKGCDQLPDDARDRIQDIQFPPNSTNNDYQTNRRSSSEVERDTFRFPKEILKLDDSNDIHNYILTIFRRIDYQDLINKLMANGSWTDSMNSVWIDRKNNRVRVGLFNPVSTHIDGIIMPVDIFIEIIERTTDAHIENNPQEENDYKLLFGDFYNKINLLRNHDELFHLSIPNLVTSIDDGVFDDYLKLTSVIIPDSVTCIGENAFRSCPALTSISISKDNPVYDSRNNCNAIIETSTNILIAGCKNTIIPDSVRSIGRRAFYGCSRLSAIKIPGSVISIGIEAFKKCTGLICAIIPDSVAEIGCNAFEECSCLEEIHVYIKNLENVSIHPDAFKGVDFYKCTLRIPEGIEMTHRNHPVFGLFRNISLIKETRPLE